MTCEHTGKSEVLEVRRTDNGTRRRKVCLECSQRYTTLETIIASRKVNDKPTMPRGFALAGWLR